MKERRKIVSVFVCMLMIASTVTILFTQENIKVEAAGGGQQGTQGNTIGLDYNYMWNVTKKISNAIHDAYHGNDIRKGRAFGSNGSEIYSRDYIYGQMLSKLSLDNVQTTKLGPIKDIRYYRRHYTSLLDVNNYQLTINHPNYIDETGYDPNVPKNETFPLPSGRRDYIFQGFGDELTHNFTFNENENIVVDVPLSPSWPTGGSATGEFRNVSCQPANGCDIIVGNVTYVNENDSLPEDQEGRVFLIDEVGGCNAKVENATNSSAVVLIHDNDKGYNIQTSVLENASSPIVRVNSDDSNLTNITERLQRGEFIVADNVQNNGTITFTFGLTSSGIEWPNHNFVVLINITDEKVHSNFDWLLTFSSYLRIVSIWHPCRRCYGLVFYSDKSDGTHQMFWHNTDWFRLFDGVGIPFPSLPVFSVNHSVGSFLEKYSGDDDNTVCGFINQTNTREYHIGSPNWWTTGVDAWDIEGHINIDKSSGDKIVVISNRHDSHWGECPGDSGAGAGMVLGIAKYFKDYNIKPKYNLTFLQTTGEETGFRGAQYWSDIHKDDNIILFIGFDQLGMEQSNTELELDFSSSLTRRIVYAIANDTHYNERTKYNIVHNPADDYHRYTNSIGHGAEDIVWMQRDFLYPKSATRCDTICFSKDDNWLHHHQTGSNFQEGDSIKNTNRSDLNITLELGWNITKYFTVNPNCWFSTINYQAVDSFGGTIPDSLKATFTVKSVLPSDLVLVNASLYDASTDHLVPNAYQEINLVIDRTGVERNVTFSMPPGVKEGDYYIKLEVYNSTARINRTLGYANHSNDTKISPTFHLNKYHTLGDIRIGTANANIHNIIRGSKFTTTEDALVHNITAYVYGISIYPPAEPTYQCMIYRISDGHLMGYSNQVACYGIGWLTFTFTPKPKLVHNTQYMLCIWGDNDNAIVYSTPQNQGNGYVNGSYTFGSPPQTILWDPVIALRQYSIFCRYSLNLPPEIINVSHSPDTVGFGYDVTINTNVTDDISGVNFVKVHITPPGGGLSGANYTMTHISGNLYRYVFTNTWVVGQYNYTIWAVNNNGYVNSSTGHHFHVSVQAQISIATLQDSYTEEQYINITDPPNPPANYTLVNRGLDWDNYYDAVTGQNILEVSAGPINYQNETGEWTPINCTLQQLPADHPAYAYGYRAGNDRGLYSVYLKPNIQNDWPVAFAYNKSTDPTTHVIRSKLVGVGYVDPASNWAYHYLQNVQNSQGQFTDNKATYENVFPGTDVTWSYKNTEMKEEITMDNTTKALLQNHPPSMYGLHNGSSYLVFITKLNYQDLNLYNTSGILTGNVTISNSRIDFRDALGYFKSALPLGDAYELNNESVREKLTYRIVHQNGNTYLLSGLKVSALNEMTFPVIIDPTLIIESLASDGYLANQSTNYNTVWAASTSGAFVTVADIFIGQKKASGSPPTYCIYRGFLLFNTSSLPSGANITSVTLSLYKKDDYSSTDFDITVQNGQPTYPHNPPQSGDYNKNHYSGNGGSLNTEEFSDGYNDISLTNHSWITKEGTTKLCLRSSRDIDGITPTGDEYVNVYPHEEDEKVTPKLVIEYQDRNQSKIKNTGSTSFKGYLLIQVQYNDSGTWVLDTDVVDEMPPVWSPRTINISDQLSLDKIFNGKVRASDLQHGEGTYRIYTAFRDPSGNILRTNDGTEMAAWWQFSKT